MGGTVTTDFTPISLCEDTSGWTATGGATLAQNLDVYVQGSASISSYKASAIDHGGRYDLGSGGTDLTGKVIFCWIAVTNPSKLQVMGSTGLRLRLTDTSGYYSEWDLGGSDTIPHGGWLPYAVHTGSTPSRTSGTLVLSAVRYVDWRADSVGAKNYIYFDAFRYGTYIQIYGGTSGDPANFEAIYQADLSNAYGAVSKISGVYFLQCSLKIGSTSASQATYFLDTSKVIVFKNGMITANYYEISNLGNTGADTEIYLGASSGGRGISGCLFRTESPTQTPKFKITLTDTNRQKAGLYGCTFIDAGVITFPAYSADREVVSCSFEASSQLDIDGTTLKYCNFINSDSRALLINDESHAVSDCNFINCPVALHFDTAGDYDLTNMAFSGCTYDVENSTNGGTVNLACSGGEPSTYENTGSPPGTTNISSSVMLKVYVKDETGTELQYIRVGIFKQSDNTQLMNELTDEDGYAEEPYNGATGFDVYVRARKSSSGSTRYFPVSQNATVSGDGLTVYITMIEDTIIG